MENIIISLYNLVYKLNKKKFNKIAYEINESIDNLIEYMEEDKDKEKINVSPIINIVGLVGDIKPENSMAGGFGLEPFYSEKGEPTF